MEDSTLGCLELTFIWAAFCLRKVAPMGAIICTGSNAENPLNLDVTKSYV